MPKLTSTVIVRVTDETREKLDRDAARLNTTTAHLVRMLLDRYTLREVDRPVTLLSTPDIAVTESVWD